jgi:hypothetical protein
VPAQNSKRGITSKNGSHGKFEKVRCLILFAQTVHKPVGGTQMGPSTSAVVRVYPVAVRTFLVALGALTWLAVGSIAQTRAYTVGPPSPALICSSAGLADLGALENQLSPANGATVQAGTPIVFSGNSESPLTFAVASSPALLSSPDIDGGLASAQPQPYSSGPPVVNTYTFTSTKATATPGVVYWDASFSTASLAQCVGLAPYTDTTTPRTLTVLPAPAPIPTPAPAPAPTPPAPPVHVSIGAPGRLHLTHPTVLYRIYCTRTCSGDTYYQALVLRRHQKTIRAPKLDLSPEPVSIPAAAGGNEQVAHPYSGRALRMFTSIIRSGGVVELQISVRVTDSSSNVAQAQRTARLSA